MSFSNTRLGSRSRRLRATSWTRPCPPLWRRSRLHTPGNGTVAMTVPEVVAVNRLMSCLERNRREGGRAPGIDRVRYHDLGRQETSRALKQVRLAVLGSSYVAPPALPVDIPKKGGTRRLMLDVLAKRALTTSVRDALAPVFQPCMSPLTYSVGGEGSGVPALLAELAAAKEFGSYGVILNLDVRQAFPSVPIDRLMAVVRRSVTDDHMLWLIETLVCGENDDSTSGIPQGLALSPQLLDLYMSDGFDAFWSNAPGMPFLLRYVDNIPCLTKNVYEGNEVVEQCRLLLRGLGLSLKTQPEEEYIIDLTAGMTTELLGFRVFLSAGKLKYDIAATALDALGDRLREAHDTTNPPVTARTVTAGWIASVGPAFDSSRDDVITSGVIPTAYREGFKEISLGHLREAWATAHGKWNDKFLQPARKRARKRMGLV